MLIKICDECGERATSTLHLQTGYVTIGDMQVEQQHIDFCGVCYPSDVHNPPDYKNVKIRWPKPFKEKEEEE